MGGHNADHSEVWYYECASISALECNAHSIMLHMIFPPSLWLEQPQAEQIFV